MPGFPDFDIPASPHAQAPSGTDLLATGLAWLGGKLQAHASQPITYARGYDAVDLRATPGKKLLKLDDGQGGIRMEWTDMDFLVPAADLDFGDGPFLPEAGDLIYLTQGADVDTYEVAPYSGEPHWRWSDPYKRMLRIHTKHVATEAA